MPSSVLPIYELESALVAALRETGRVVVQAPTGSGKSTQVPRMLLRHGFLDTGEAVVLQPRRLATRMLARRVADEEGSALGGVVGYQIRLEGRTSAATKIRFVTEGILLRQMSFETTLRGVNAVVFDEFHERHLFGDISLARALQIQRTTRPDLKIIVMSATLDAGALREYLAPCAVLESAGRSYPVDVSYLARTPNFDREPVWDVATAACAEAASDTSGDMLVFMPGAYEINRTVQALETHRSLREFEVFPLHGELSSERQDAAVARSEGRKIIVSTNVAETSLTIEGVTIVIDAGLARVARFDARRGINTLLIEKISRASADQRAGRAGRTAPGRCVRLWTEREHADRPSHELPEVHRLDLTEVVLTLKSSGIDDVAGFAWLEAPEPRGLERAEALLHDLGAIASGPTGAITEVGRRMLRFPVHPRYARMFIEAEARGCVRSVALMAAITQGRNFLLRGVSRSIDDARDDTLGDEGRSDFFRLMRAWQYAQDQRFQVEACQRLGIHAQGARQVGPLFDQFLRIAEKEGLLVGDDRGGEDEVRKCVLAGFSDHLARRLDRGTLRCELVHGRRGVLARESALQDAPLLVAAEISEIEGRGGEVNVLLTLATAVEEPWLQELFPDDFTDGIAVVLDESTRRVVARRERRFRDLVLESKLTAEKPPEGRAAELLAQAVAAGTIKLGEWNEAVDQWIVRVNRLAEWFPELEVSPITDEDRTTLVEQICHGSYGARDLKDKPVMPVLRQWLRAEQLAVLDDYLPERIVMDNGRRARVRYAAEGPPILSARVQELVEIKSTYALGHGRVPVRFEVLAPNQRPIQVTDNLRKFWDDLYPNKIRPELSRHYPKHPWP
ncbi:ATP-dependent helicase HrpB [Synoicihabitans lomoniglobus]|uniref:ATP-dependent helicase HrpB n=1 Tax=Synoicihabitans lomoniglobus TaxID=2909285 RepID=A0AAF0CRK1_9BACT|nr:ATP-dependent helicase HrpB [Opitutaceae bacterium LMO-M01]WED66746.1 ATP-dependent helicase HrpB [Opitutaceae bacterium LMO-M01]